MNGTVIYTRISDDRLGEGLGVARQEKDGRALCETRGWSDPDVIVDNDVSAYSGRRRPGYLRLLEGIRAGTWERLVVWHPDRLHRSPLELEEFIKIIEDTGCEVVSVTAGDYDLATPEGRLVARITGSVARKESEDKSRRSRRKHMELAEAGKVAGGGTRPFGYRDRQTVDPDEAALIVDAVDRLLAGETVRGIVREWNTLGIPTTTGGRWSAHVFKRMVTSGRICGWREHRGDLVTVATWSGIVEREKVDRLRVLLRDPARRMNTRSRRYLLTGGIARCGVCGAALVARPKDGGARQYVCAKDWGGCGRLARLAEPVEAFVSELLFKRLDSPEYAAAVAVEAGMLDEIDAATEVRACEAKLEDLAGQWAADVITRGEWLAARQGVEQRLNAAQRRLTLTKPNRLAPGSGSALRASWADLTFDQQRADIEAAVDRVEFLRAVRGRNRFDPTKIKVTWRG